MKNNTYIWAGAGIGITILIAYYLSPKNTKLVLPENKISEMESDNYHKPNTKELPKSVTESGVRDTVNHTWMLIRGSTGKEVERLQTWLLRNHGWKGPITGVYDKQTDALVQKRFGKDHVDKDTYDKYKMGIPIYEQIKQRS